ncbi:MAG: DUF1453 family protein [Novosphingobium sp.]|nr:DUF1453 family protein [Novosphingobium sp.]
MQQSGQAPLGAYLFTGLIILVVLFFRMRGMSKVRPLKVETLWLVPVVFLGIAALSLWQLPPAPGDIPWLVVAFALGAALGWQRGRLMRIWTDGDGRLMAQGSPWALLFLVALIVIRTALRSGLEMERDAWAISPALINDGFIVFAVGLFGVMRVEMWLRARRLLREHGGTAA